MKLCMAYACCTLFRLLDGCGKKVGEEWPRAMADAYRGAPNIYIAPLRSSYANCVDQFWRRLWWRRKGVGMSKGASRRGANVEHVKMRPADARYSPIRWSTGLLLVSLALDVCDTVTVYGFWPFRSKNGQPVPYHYNERTPLAGKGDDRIDSNTHHSWSTEWELLTKLGTKLTVHTEPCEDVASQSNRGSGGADARAKQESAVAT